MGAQFIVGTQRGPMQSLQYMARAALQQLEHRRAQQRVGISRQQLQQRDVAKLQSAVRRRHGDPAAHEIE